MEHSPEMDKLAAALTKVQAALTAARADSTNPHFGNKYADLSSVWDAARKPLTDNGLSVVQMPGYDAATEVVTLTTVLLHTSGQWLAAPAGAPVGKLTAQNVGSALTYLRRYGLSAFVGITAEDDDGNAGSSQEAVSRKKGPRPNWVSETGEVMLPGDTKKWDGHGGKRIADKTIPESVLVACRDWFKGKNAEPDFVAALDEELDNRRTA